MTKRIEYIDALRGFTMILVVAVHVYSLCFMQGDSTEYDLSYNNFFGLFRMPLFFFISGFVFFKAEQIWDYTTLKIFFKNKTRVQLLSTLAFFLLFCFLFQRDILLSLTDSQKAGYWFTYTLFIYFSLYIGIDIIICWLGKKKPFNDITITATFIVGLSLFYLINNGILLNILPPKITLTLSINKWQYFLFFAFGCFTHKYYSCFIKWQNSRYLIDGILLIFAAMSICFFYQNNNSLIISNSIVRLCTSIMGIILIMTLFRTNENNLTKSTKLGSALQYIGKHTLDIYFLHYFFLPYNLAVIGKWFENNPNPLLEFCLSALLALVIITCCLIVSRIIRISPLFTFLLLGGKKNK